MQTCFYSETKPKIKSQSLAKSGSKTGSKSWRVNDRKKNKNAFLQKMAKYGSMELLTMWTKFSKNIYLNQINPLNQ